MSQPIMQILANIIYFSKYIYEYYYLSNTDFKQMLLCNAANINLRLGTFKIYTLLINAKV